MKLVIIDQDLRVHDNPALYYALNQANKDMQDIIVIYILDEINKRAIGLASKWFLNNLLQNFQKELLNKANCNLYFFKGDSLKIITQIHKDLNISQIFMNNSFEPSQHNLIKKLAIIALVIKLR